jgi:hypothetical protein
MFSAMYHGRLEAETCAVVDSEKQGELRCQRKQSKQGELRDKKSRKTPNRGPYMSPTDSNSAAGNALFACN